VKIRINGEWKNYPVSIEAVTGNRWYIRCEQLQRDWSLLLMEWVQEIYITYNYEYERPVIVGRYDVDGIPGGDILFFA